MAQGTSDFVLWPDRINYFPFVNRTRKNEVVEIGLDFNTQLGERLTEDKITWFRDF